MFWHENNQLFLGMLFNKATLRKYSNLLVQCQDSTTLLAVRWNYNDVATTLKDAEHGTI